MGDNGEKRLALVTGASRGIGKAVALRLAAEGCDLALVCAGNREGVEATRAQAEALGVCSRAYLCDISDFNACEQLMAVINSEMGKLSVLVNNAGITRDMLLMRMKDSDFSRVLDVNLKGAFNLIRHSFSQIMRAEQGRIVNISSVVGIHGNAGQANYAAAKAGLIGLTRSVAKELASRQATCNAIAPGIIDTDMSRAIPDEKREDILSQVPMRRAGSAEEVAALVSFLASQDAAYITGAVIPIDGGFAM